MKLQDQLIRKAEVGETEPHPVAEIRCCRDGRERGIVVQARQKDQRIRIGCVDPFRCCRHLCVPCPPVVRVLRVACGGLAKLIAQSDTDKVGPFFGLAGRSACRASGCGR